MFKLGLIVNPLAGIGGPLALKGSDGDAAQEALALSAAMRAPNRATEALKLLDQHSHHITVYCWSGLMGEQSAIEAGLSVEAINKSPDISTAQDTMAAAKQLVTAEVDLLVFVGGDGTARDVFTAVGSAFPVLGIPSGVKMHSGVYAVSPQAAGEMIGQLIAGKLIDIGLAEVRDIDEDAFRQGQVKSRFYGELLVPKEGRFLQQVKQSGREVEELVVQDIAADIIESMDDECLYLIGPGTTPKGIMDELKLENTLLGIDAIRSGELLGSDLSEKGILALIDEHNGPVNIIITAIGGQGHIVGRGNQQLSPAVIRLVGLDNIHIVATKTKITELEGRPLLVDSNDPKLDKAFAGYRKVVTGYHDSILYPVGLSNI